MEDKAAVQKSKRRRLMPPELLDRWLDVVNGWGGGKVVEVDQWIRCGDEGGSDAAVEVDR